jgi:biotin carboxyl carrier protein
MKTTHITLGDKTYKVELTPDGPPLVNGKPISIDVRHLQPGLLSLLHTTPEGRTTSYACIADPAAEDAAILINGQRIPYAVTDPRSLRATSATATASGPRPLKAPMPGRIVRVLIAQGDTVEQGQGCVVIEAMKMQNELKAPKAGKITKLAAIVGETVQASAILLIVE